MEPQMKKSSSAKLCRGSTRIPKPHSVKNPEDMNLTVSQLLAPPALSSPSKEVFVTNLNKPDVHLRPDLNGPTEMFRIHSANRTKHTASSTDLILDDESKQGAEVFSFEEMVRIGRPERDTTLKKPLARSLQMLRRYKLGISPAQKAGMLRDSLEPIVQDPKAKRMLSAMSPRGRPMSPLLQQNNSLVFTDSFSLVDEFGNNFMPTTKSAPNLRTTSADGATSGEVKKVVVKQNANLHLYHLSSQGKRTVQNKTGNFGMSKQNNTNELVTDSLASSVPNAPPEDGDDASENPAPVMYDPATVRLPRMEIVPGFGTTTPLVDSRLGAYRVHSSKAVSAAAALEEASVFEGVSRTLSMNSKLGGDGDSYKPDRVESFYRSAETSHLFSLEEQAADLQMRDIGDASIGSRSAETSVQSPSLEVAPAAPPHSAVPTASKRGLHCGKCFRQADMWCQRCASAFCSVCWGQVPHHDLEQMAPPARPRTEASASRSGSSASSPVQSPAKHTYAKSVLFQTYTSNNRPATGAKLENSRYNSTSAAKIPLPDFVITQYDQYPAPPVYIDGKGHVLEDIIKRRPVTAPVFTQEDLHRLQMSNHFKRQSAQEQHAEKIALKYKAATAGIPSGVLGGSSGGAESTLYPSLGVTSGFHYEQKEPLPMAHSKGKVVVRKNKKKNPVLRPTSPSLVATPTGQLSLGYSPKPRTNTKPMTGILRDGTPDDWKTALFAGNDIKEGEKSRGPTR